MAISDEKLKIVINNYFKSECDVNTSIREAFEKGFRIGAKKGLMQIGADRKTEPTGYNLLPVDKDINVRSKTEPQTDYTPDCPFCKRYGTEECLGFDCRHYKTYKDEPQTERSSE